MIIINVKGDSIRLTKEETIAALKELVNVRKVEPSSLTMSDDAGNPVTIGDLGIEFDEDLNDLPTSSADDAAEAFIKVLDEM